MRFVKLKMAALLALGVLLTACGGAEQEEKSARELYQQASELLYADNARYNFSSDMKIGTTVANPFTEELRLTLNGAIDNKELRYELRPEVEAGVFSVKMPLLLDAGKKQLVLDPSNLVDTVGMFVPDAAQQLAKYRGKHVRFSLSNFDVDSGEMEEVMLVFAELLRIGTGALNQFYTLVPDSSIQKLELDSKAKELKATAKIRVDLDSAQSRELQRQINAYFIAEVEKSQVLPAECKVDFVEAMQDIDSYDNGVENSSSIMYINASGQLVHGQETYNFNVEDESATLIMTTDYSNYGKPEFKIAPKESDIIEITQQELEQFRG